MLESAKLNLYGVTWMWIFALTFKLLLKFCGLGGRFPLQYLYENGRYEQTNILHVWKTFVIEGKGINLLNEERKNLCVICLVHLWENVQYPILDYGSDTATFIEYKLCFTFCLKFPLKCPYYSWLGIFHAFFKLSLLFLGWQSQTSVSQWILEVTRWSAWMRWRR